MTGSGTRKKAHRTADRLLLLALCAILSAPASGQSQVGVRFGSTSVIRKTPSGDRQLVVAHIISDDTLSGAGAEVVLPGQSTPVNASIGTIPRGSSSHFFEIPVVREADTAVFHLLIGTSKVYSTRGPIAPPRPWKIYDVQVSHHDLGYADYYHFMRRDVREMGLDMALDFCRRTDSWSVNDRFRWTVETSEPMTRFISAQSPGTLRELTRRIEEGRIVLGALHNSVYTEMMGYESMARLFYTPNRHIVDLLGIPPSKTALITDVVGFARTLPTYLKEAGIPYFYHGYNETVNGMYPASAEPVFYWKGHDGDTRTMPLVRSFPYYSPDRLTKYTVKEIAGVLEKYERPGAWPYDCLIAEDSYDFSVPHFENVEGIRSWNERYANPVLISGTFTMFFDDVKGQADTTRIKAFDQDAPNAWADQDAADGRLMADARLLNFDLPTVEKLATLAYASGGRGYPWKEIWQAYHKLLSYHEHTNGAFSEEDVLPIPMQKNPKAANPNYYEVEQVMHRGLVSEAKEFTLQAKAQAVEQFRQLITTNYETTVVVFNPLPFTRTGVASLVLPHDRGVRVVDNGTGEEIPYQRMPDGSLLFAVTDVPSMGYRTYRLVSGAPMPAPAAHAAASSEFLENEFYRIRIDDTTGAVASIHDKKRNRELVDHTSKYRFNQYLYHRIDQAFTRKPTEYLPRMISRESFAGPLASGIVTTIAAKGCRSVKQTVILYRMSDRIDFVVDLDKSESGRMLKQATAQNKEALYYVLPFDIPDFTIHHELPGGVVEPLAHQFKGSTSSYFGIQHFTDLSNPEYGVTLASVNAPLVVYGPPRAALWLAPSDAEFDAKKPDRSHVSFYLMNNMFFTNIPLSQPGPATFRWSLRSHDGDWVAGRAPEFAWETSHPFETFVIEKRQRGALPPDRHSFLSVDGGNVACSTIKPAEANGDGFILRFFELGGKQSSVRVRLPAFGTLARACETSLIEQDGTALPVSHGNELTFSMRPFGIKTIRVVPANASQPAAPAAVRAHATSDREVSLTWTEGNAKDVSYYRIYRGTTADFTPSLASWIGTSTLPTYDDRPLLNHGGWLDNRIEPGIEYFYRVQAVGSLGGASEPSTTVRVTTLSATEKNSPPHGVLGLAATNVSPVSSFNYICLLFCTNIESDVTHYRIHRSQTPGFGPDRSTLLDDVDARRTFDHVIPHGFATVTRELRDYSMIVYPDESVKPNQRYYYRVCAVDEAGQAGPFSEEVSAISDIRRLTFAGDLFFFDSAMVDIRPVLGDGSEIRYTTDGSEPSAASGLYTGPFTITKPQTVKAALFYPGSSVPPVAGQATYMRALYPPPKYLQPFSEKWPGQGALNMVDGARGATYFDGYFQGFEHNDMDVIVDLGGKKEIQEIRTTMLQDIRAWIFFPEEVEFFVSHDGANFEPVGTVRTVNENERKDGVFLKEYTVTMESRQVNFVRVRAKNVGMCPPWHIGYEYKGKAWVFADEISVR